MLSSFMANKNISVEFFFLKRDTITLDAECKNVGVCIIMFRLGQRSTSVITHQNKVR